MTNPAAVPGNACIVKMKYGSHVYGTDVPTSDQDLKAVFLPTARDILLQQVRDNISVTTKDDITKGNKPTDIDFEAFSLQQFVKLLLEGQTVALDMLFTPQQFYLSLPGEPWRELVAQKEKFLSRKIEAIAKYCQRQAAKYGLKGSRIAVLRRILDLLGQKKDGARLEEFRTDLEEFVKSNSMGNNDGYVRLISIDESHRTVPGEYLDIWDRKIPLDAHVRTAKKIYKKALDNYGERALLAEKNEGIDWKALMHSVRVTYEARELLVTGEITFPRPERELLLRIRKGELAYQDVATLIDTGLEELKIAREGSSLQESPDRVFADDFVVRHYRNVVMGKIAE